MLEHVGEISNGLALHANFHNSFPFNRSMLRGSGIFLPFRIPFLRASHSRREHSINPNHPVFSSEGLLEISAAKSHSTIDLASCLA